MLHIAVKSKLRQAVATIMRPLVFPGRHHVYKLISSLLGDEPLPFDVPLQRGLKLRVNNPFWQHLFYLRDYERDVRVFLEKATTPMSTVFDVGASIGILTLPLARKAKRVFAFDALRENYDMLITNINLNRARNVTAMYAAVSDQQGTLRAPIPVQHSNYSLASEGRGFVEIPAVTLDDFCQRNNIERIDVMKIDIEGSETKALRGCSRMLRTGRVGTIVIEFNNYWLRKMGSSPNELYDLFETYNLTVHELTRLGRAKRISRQECMAKLRGPKSYFNLVLTADSCEVDQCS